MTHVIEVREPESAPRRIEISGVVEAGREAADLVLADPEVSRRHVQLSSDGTTLSVEDLGSTNGTAVNGVRIGGPTVLHDGDVVRVGATTIAVVVGTATPELDEPVAPPRGDGVVRPQRADPAWTRSIVKRMAVVPAEGAAVRYRPGSVGERVAKSVADSVARARKRLRGLGAAALAVQPDILLTDPFPDPGDPSRMVTSGTVVDVDRAEVWMVVTPESPPEPLERPLALVFGAELPAAAEMGLLLEGYGLHVSGAPDPDPTLQGLPLPLLHAADGEVRPAMALSFVRYLIERGGEAGFVATVTSATAGALDRAAQETYGLGMAALEEAWRNKLAAGPPDFKAGRFFALIRRYLRPHLAREAEMAVYMLLGLAFTAVFPFALRRLVDHALPSRHFSETVHILAALSAAFVVSMLAGLRRAYLAAYVSCSVVREVRAEMFDRIQALSSSWFTTRQEGDVLSRLFTDVQMMESGLSQTVREGVNQVLSLIVSAVVLIRLDVLLSVIVLAAAPLVALIYRSMSKGAQRRSIAVSEETATVIGVATENYQAQPVVKAFGLEQVEAGRFRRSADRLFNRQMRLQIFSGLFGLSVNMVMTALRIFIIGLGAWLILHGHLTVGGLMAFMGSMGDVVSPVTAITGIGQQIQLSTGALVRINEVLESVPDIADRPDAVELPPLAREIRLRRVGFSYTPERRTLDDVDVTIRAGERVAFVGPTGAGKSSVLGLVMRFYDPDEGSVSFDDNDVRSVTLASLRGQLGVVFQETFLFNGSIRENIALAKPDATDDEIHAAAQAAELHDFVMSLPRGYDTLVGERGGRLSGGQRQRLAIARALLRDPRVLILDEATSALDPRTERLIADTLNRVGEGRTTLAVTHRLGSVVHYDRIVVLTEGRVVEQGTHDELVALGGVYATLWAEQTGGAAPVEAPFDAVGALARVPVFADLGPEQLAEVATRLQAGELRAGDSVPEGGGRLFLVRRGRARVLAPGLNGELAPAADLGPGDAFGAAALLGNETGLVLVATEPVALVFLDDDAIAGLAARLPSVGAALAGTAPAAAPEHGLRLSRVSMGPMPAFVAGSGAGEAAGPSPAEVSRLSGSFQATPR